MVFVGFCNLLLVFFLRECLKHTVESSSTGLESRNKVLCGALEECNHVGDKFVLALDGGKCVELICTEVYCLFYVSGFERGQCVALLYEVLEELRGSITYVGAHERSAAVEGTVKFAVVTFKVLECLVEKFVLHNHELDVGIVASATELRGLFSIESCSLYEVETIVGFDSLLNLLYDASFFFLFHCLDVLEGLSIDRLGVDLDTRAHSARKINALDVCAFGSSGLELDQGSDELTYVLKHRLGCE